MTNTSKNYFCIWALSIGILCAVFVLLRHPQKPQGASVSYHGYTLPVSIADTPQALEKGLSGTAMLAPDTGMLFIFKTPGQYGFWMKDMQYPLDIIWLDSSFKIVHIEENVTPATYPKIFYGTPDTLYVLEVNAHTASKMQFIEGQNFTFKRASI